MLALILIVFSFFFEAIFDILIFKGLINIGGSNTLRAEESNLIMRSIVIRVYIYFGSSPPNFLKIEVYLLLGVSYSEVRISKPVRRLEVYKLDELADKKWINFFNELQLKYYSPR